MTLRLILTRHAKSDWDDPLASDHARVLNARGRRSAPLVGQWLAGHGHLPSLALVSDSQRTRETWALLARELPGPVPVRFLSALYCASPQGILRALSATEESAVMVIAHNPGIGALATDLAVRAPAHPAFTRFPTCATVVLEFDATEWGQVRPHSAQVIDFVVPRDLEAVTSA